MIDCSIADNHKLIGVIALFAWQVLEFWLGKTEKVKAGSTPEFVNNLIISGVKFIWRLIWKKPTT